MIIINNARLALIISGSTSKILARLSLLVLVVLSLLLFNYCCLDLILSLSRVALLGIRQSVPWSSNNHGWALNFHKGCLTRPTGKEGGNIWLRNAIYPTLTALHCLLAVLFVFPPTNINSNTNIVGPTTTNTNTNNNPSNNNNFVSQRSLKVRR